MKSRNVLMIGLIGALLLTGCGTAADSKQAEETDEVASSSSLTETSSVTEAASEIETSSDTEDGTEENAEAGSSLFFSRVLLVLMLTAFVLTIGILLYLRIHGWR